MYFSLFTGSSNWAARSDAVGKITLCVLTHPDVLRDAGRMESCVDRILERLEDGSIKVVQRALASVQQIQLTLPTVFTASPASTVALIGALLGASSSSNKHISTAAAEQLGAFVRRPNVPLQSTVAQLCAIATHERERVRASAFRVLTDMVQSGQLGATDSLVKKSLFPALCGVLLGAGVKGEVRGAAADTLRALQRVLLKEGKQPENMVWTWVQEPAKQEEMKRLTVTL
jgi:hypothetical protein